MQEKDNIYNQMQGPKKGQPLYLGLFATDPKGALNTVKSTCKDSILEVLKYANPQGYLPEGQHLPQHQKQSELQINFDEQTVKMLEKDYANFEGFSSPNDNYHMTSLFLGKNKDKMKKEEKQIMNNWKNGVKEPIKVDFIVYIPGYLMAGSISEVGKIQVANKCPHMTLLLKEKASAVQSNFVLQLLLEKAPEIFKKRSNKVTHLNIPYKGAKSLIVINNSFTLEGVSGDNRTNGKK